MSASIQNLIEEIKGAVSEKDELEFQLMSEIKTLSPILAYHFQLRYRINLYEFWKRTVHFKYEAIGWHFIGNKNVTGRPEKNYVRIPMYVKTKSTVWQFCSIKILN